MDNLYLFGIYESVVSAAGLVCGLLVTILVLTAMSFDNDLSLITRKHRNNDEELKECQASKRGHIKFASLVAFFLIVFSGIALLPKTDDLWRIRLNLLKMELAKPENVSAGIDRINEISKSLECKYLDPNKCEPKEESKNDESK